MNARPQDLAGYSGTPLPKKLGIKPGHRVAFFNPPESFAAELGELPPGVSFAGADETGLDVIVLFVRSAAELRAAFTHRAAAIKPAGSFWVSWPKKASGVRTDLTEGVVRRIALERGLVDVKVAAIDATWSGLKLVYRLKDRPPT